jgi:beta-lactamase superfamily II metal-dependent hydrolase
MREDIHVRTVVVELLRPGPAHNQLLSPLTPYIGVCDDAEAGLVTLPYEQHTFERRMRAMRHDDKAIVEDKLPDLRDLGVELAKVLGSVPRLPGSLAADPRGKETLVRLSLKLSASELAALPFELAKVPVGPNAATENWLQLQAHMPVVITRRTRNVSVYDLKWLHDPRILFVASDPKGGNIPFAAHRRALIDAATPFLMPRERQGQRSKASGAEGDEERAVNRREAFGDVLTILSNATFEGLVEEFARRRYTHVHILAHGERDESLGDHSFGLRLHPRDGVISGERLASALARVSHSGRVCPQVVTLATCDSGAVRDVVNPGAGLVHELHRAGIPLVVGSQVPLSFAASVLFVNEFYRGLLWGQHPWILLYRVRSALHSRLKPMDHDWASLVVYESLPSELTRHLEEARFRQCRAAMDVALASPPYEPWPGFEGDPVEVVMQRLPVKGRYFGMEALALRADGHLKIARDYFNAGLGDPKNFESYASHSHYHLERALDDYGSAVNGFLVMPGQGMNAPYRTAVAKLAILGALGKKVEWGMWEMVRYWIEATVAQTGNDEDRASAYGCLAELWLLRQLDPAFGPLHASVCRDQALQALQEMLRSMTRPSPEEQLKQGDPPQSRWMRDRLDFYLNWWSHPKFEALVNRQLGSQDVRLRYDTDEPNSMTSLARELRRQMAMRLGGNVEPATPIHDASDEQVPSPAEEAVQQQWLGAADGKPGAAGKKAQAKTNKPAKATQAAKSSPGSANGNGARLSIEMLAADQGDALIVQWARAGGPLHRMLIDCGTTRTWARTLKPRILQGSEQERHFELFILSHIDSDHIEGALPLMKEMKALNITFGDVWFNGRHHLDTKLSGKHGEKFSEAIRSNGLKWNHRFGGAAVVREEGTLPEAIELADGMQLTLLSPVPTTLERLGPAWDADLKPAPPRSKKLGRTLEDITDLDQLAERKFEADPSKPNGSSIAVLAEFGGKSLLLAADVYAPVLEEALALLCRRRRVKALPLDAFKLSHHASRNNLSVPVMKLVQCSQFLVSTNGDKHEHPDREAIARCIKYGAPGTTLWFNYLPEDEYHLHWFAPATQKEHGYAVRHPERGASAGIRMDLL